MIDSDSTRPIHIRLLRGQAHCEQLKQGTLIRVVTGTLSLTSHVWLDNTLLTQTTPVHSGCVYGLPSCGWFELAAQSDVELSLVLPASRSPMAWLVAGVIRLLALKPVNRAPQTDQAYQACALSKLPRADELLELP